MSNKGFSINDAAKKLNVSTRTIGRQIKAGKIKAELIKGSFGDEYRILEWPPQFDPNLPPEKAEKPGPDNDEAIDRYADRIAFSVMDLIRELQEKNLALAAQLGAAAERIHEMEAQLKLLASPEDSEPQAAAFKDAATGSWWSRLFPHLLVGPDVPSEKR
jgi:MerR family transcriptional regulator, copper efflux regulator